MTETLVYRARRRLARAWADLDRCAGTRAADPYAPRPPQPFDTEVVELRDPATGFTIVCTVRIPSGAEGPLPVVMFTKPPDWVRDDPAPDGSFITEHLAAAGYATINLSHPDSDRIVLPVSVSDAPDKLNYVNERFYDPRGHAARIGDLRFVIGAIENWSREGRWNASLDTSRIGLSGFSYGALATCLMMGQRMMPGLADHREPRIRAAVTYSNVGLDMNHTAPTFENIERPALYMAGALDFSYGRSLGPQRKLAAYDLNNAKNQYSVMLRGADHHGMGGARLDKGKAGPRELLCHQWMRSVTLAFWDAWLRDDASARRWLDHDLHRLLGSDGTFRRK